MKKRKIFLLTLAIFVLSMGVTYAGFVFTASNNSVTGNMIGSQSISVSVNQVSTDTKGYLIPQSASTLGNAIVGTSGKSCIDGNGNTVCKVYSIVI